MPSVFRHVVIFAGLAFATPAQAQGFQSIDAIETQVVAALGAPIGSPGGPARPIDRRLRLTICPAPIIIEPLAMGAATVRCQQIGWRLRVPVLPSGGASPVRSATAGTPRATRAEPVVRRGDPVALVVLTGGFSVTRQAIAEQDGAPGDRIRVRTEPRAAPIIGQVLADGRVAMPGF